MKNLYLLPAILLLSANTFSQLQLSAAYYFEEAFHTETKLNDVHNYIYYENDCSDIAKWITSDSLTQAGFRHSNQQITDHVDYLGEILSPGYENGYFFVNGSAYIENGTVEAQDSKLELDTTFDLSGLTEGILEFDQKYRAFNYDETFVEISVDNGLSWQVLDSSNNSELPNGPIYNTSKRIPLKSNYLVSDVRFRFHWKNDSTNNLKGSGYIWAIDNFRIKSDAENDVELVDFLNYSEYDSLDYYLISDGNFNTKFGGIIQNKSASLQKTVFELYNSFNNQTYRSDTIDIEPFDTDTLFLNGFIDIMNLSWEMSSFQCISSENASSINYNDSIYQDFGMINHMFGRDQFKYITDFNGLNISDTHAIKIGNKMKAPYDLYFNGVSIGIGADLISENQTIWAEIYKLNTQSGDYEFLTKTYESTVTSGMTYALSDFCFNDEVILSTNDEFLILACYNKPIDIDSDGRMDPPRFILSQETREGSVAGFKDGEYFELINPRAVMIRTQYCWIGIDENKINNNLNSFPNPFSNNLTVSLNTINNENVNVEVYNLDGRLVLQKNNIVTYNGTVNLNLGSLSNGVYTLKVISDESISESKIIKQ